ncbi:MAG: hypothetical protein LBR76_02470 [Oscillospiraceae bacterium]|jgi:hypothetical protein|nr:hypothetical protein [Oscillospiraceae bacterium]
MKGLLNNAAVTLHNSFRPANAEFFALISAKNALSPVPKPERGTHVCAIRWSFRPPNLPSIPNSTVTKPHENGTAVPKLRFFEALKVFKKPLDAEHVFRV